MSIKDYSEEAVKDIVDGCSGGVTWFYKTFFKRDIGCRFCCDEHDVAYYEGGTEKDRRIADKRFRECVWESKRHIWAWVFWAFARLFGWAFWKYPK